MFISENPELGMKARVTVDGIDISRRCYGADEEKGEAYCYVLSDKGMIDIAHTLDCKASRGALRG